MPDYSDQYPDYWQRLRNAEKPVFSQDASVGHKTARVRISSVRPKNAVRFMELSVGKKKKFYTSHNCYIPLGFRFGAWGRVRDEKG